MIGKFAVCASLAGLLLLSVPAHGGPAPPGSQTKQQAEQPKQVAGKVTDIGSDKKSFSLEVNDKGSKHVMQFLVDGNTQVQGRVSVGTDAIVQYQPTSDGKLLALSVGPQNGQGAPSGR
jgi:hypothetical protein